jgi:hypothetical protein
VPFSRGDCEVFFDAFRPPFKPLQHTDDDENIIIINADADADADGGGNGGGNGDGKTGCKGKGEGAQPTTLAGLALAAAKAKAKREKRAEAETLHREAYVNDRDTSLQLVGGARALVTFIFALFFCSTLSGATAL